MVHETISCVGSSQMSCSASLHHSGTQPPEKDFVTFEKYSNVQMELLRMFHEATTVAISYLVTSQECANLRLFHELLLVPANHIKRP